MTRLRAGTHTRDQASNRALRVFIFCVASRLIHGGRVSGQSDLGGKGHHHVAVRRGDALKYHSGRLVLGSVLFAGKAEPRQGMALRRLAETRSPHDSHTPYVPPATRRRAPVDFAQHTAPEIGSNHRYVLLGRLDGKLDGVRGLHTHRAEGFGARCGRGPEAHSALHQHAL